MDKKETIAALMGENPVMVIIYAFVLIAVLYTLFKTFGALSNLKESIEHAGKKVKEYAKHPAVFVKDVVETPLHQTVQNIEKTHGSVGEWEKKVIEPLGELGAPAVYLPEQSKEEPVKAEYKTNEEIMRISGERWQAIADYYRKHQAQKEQQKQNAIIEEITRFKQRRGKKLIKPVNPPLHVLPVNPRERIVIA